MKRITLPFEYLEYESYENLPEADRLLLDKARVALKSAYTPYSHFCVGAAVSLENGIVVTGNNQENRAFPSGLCAERVAIYSAAANHPGVSMNSIAITAHSDGYPVGEPVPPCGACRQAMLEYELNQGKPLRVILSGESGKVFVTESVKSLLPLAFTEERVGKNNPDSKIK